MLEVGSNYMYLTTSLPEVMKKLILTLTAAGILMMGVRPVQAGDREWATAGKILTGVVAASVLSQALQPSVGYTEVRTTHFGPRICQPPVVVQQPAPVIIQQPAPVVVQQPSPVVIQQPAPVYYSAPPVVHYQPAPVVTIAPVVRCAPAPLVTTYSWGRPVVGHGHYSRSFGHSHIRGHGRW